MNQIFLSAMPCATIRSRYWPTRVKAKKLSLLLKPPDRLHCGVAGVQSGGFENPLGWADSASK